MTHKLHRARGRLRKHLAPGFQRAVFAAPHRGDDDPPPRVFEAEGPVDDVAFDTWMDRAAAAAEDGFVKQTWILDDRRRAEVDARHGHVKLKTRDEATVDKMMGGKDRPLRPDHSADLLRAIGIMNPDGSISAKHAKKYKQVNHFVALAKPSWEAAASKAKGRPLRVLDAACGNAYLTFVLREALRLAEVPVEVRGVDARQDVIERARERAQTLGWSRDMTFEVGRIADLSAAGASDSERPDLLLSLHACDTATDEALALGIRTRVPALLCAPCCQAEVARQLDGGHTPTPALGAHGLLRREYASLFTDAVRVDLLEAHGYDVTCVEFVDSTHTPKNLLIRAHLKTSPDAAAIEAVAQRCRDAGVEPSLLRLLVG